MKTLHLTLKKKWFDMIASGEKKEEYREIKPYWNSRLTSLPRSWCMGCPPEQIESEKEWCRMFDVVMFRNGYSRKSSIIRYKCTDVTVDVGKPEWGAEPGKKYFVIKLGEKL